MKGYMGSVEAALFALGHMDELYARFRKDYVDEGLRQLKNDANAAVPAVTVLGALYKLAGEHKCGYEVNLRRIPVRQFTIEICELFGLNPFELKGNIEIKLQATGEVQMPGIAEEGLQTSGDEEKKIPWDESQESVEIGIATKKLQKIYIRD